MDILEIVRKERKEKALKQGWTPEEIEKGYFIASSDEIGNGALHIERIDCLKRFKNDDEAAMQAESDGIRLIHDIPIKPTSPNYANYIDTPENRETLLSIFDIVLQIR